MWAVRTSFVKENGMKHLLIAISSVLTGFAIWIANNHTFASAAVPAFIALITLGLGIWQKDERAIGHKLAFLLVATFFISFAIYTGVKNSGANLATTITIPVMIGLLCLVASCLDEMRWETVAAISIPIFVVAGLCFDTRAWWFIIPPILFVLRDIGKENERLNQSHN